MQQKLLFKAAQFLLFKTKHERKTCCPAQRRKTLKDRAADIKTRFSLGANGQVDQVWAHHSTFGVLVMEPQRPEQDHETHGTVTVWAEAFWVQLAGRREEIYGWSERETCSQLLWEKRLQRRDESSWWTCSGHWRDHPSRRRVIRPSSRPHPHFTVIQQDQLYFYPSIPDLQDIQKN